MPILELNAEEYRRYLTGEKPLLLEFSAPWCVYCRRLAPALEALAEEYGETLTVGQIDIDKEPDLAREAGVQVVPTLLLYQGGQLLGSVTAPESKARLEAFLRETLPEAALRDGGAERIYDMIVVGGGPGGYTAALYAARAGLRTVVLEKLSAGGQMALTNDIDNYPGFDAGIDGFSLGERMRRGAERFGAETRLTEALSLELSGAVKRVETAEGALRGRTVVLATGAGHRPLGVAGEEALVGRGVSYCAACDGMLYKGKTVVIVGGGNSAAADALLLSRICEKVILVHRRDTLRATKVYHEPLMQAANVEFCWNSTVEALLAEKTVRGVRLRDIKTGEERTVDCQGVFISVGRAPATELVRGLVALDEAGYVAADETTRTSVPGVFAVGDVRAKPVRQVVTATADGAVAVHYAERYLSGG